MRNDNNDFRESGKLYVRYFSAAERRNLLDAVRNLGISAGDMNKGKFKYDPNATNTFEIDIREKTIDYVAQPSVCAAMCSSGARFFSVTEFLRLAELNFEVLPRFLLWHIPHDGRKFPIKLLCSVSVARDEFEAYHEKMRDTGVRELIPGAYDYQSAVAAFDVSRLLCDVERYIGSDEVMERYGMGFCYEKVYDGTVIKDVSDGLKSRTLRYYNEHHQKVNEKCESHPQTLLFDMHSYSDEIVPADFLEEGRQTPDVCIGTDSEFTPLSLSAIAKYRFEEAGFSAELNYPYSGCYVPESAVSGKADCISVMFEFNKRIYLNDDGEVDGEKRAAIRAVLEKIIADCVDPGDGENSSRNKDENSGDEENTGNKDEKEDDAKSGAHLKGSDRAAGKTAADELNELIGLDNIKETIGQITAFAKLQKMAKKQGRKAAGINLNLSFLGNPGTAKTTVARLFARIMKENGILSKGELIEVGRSELVAKYVGQTAIKVKRVFKRAAGNVLFIDEAYSLVDTWGNGYGDEAIATIVQEMENNREDMIVIFAGYPDKMEEFLSRNPGLRSRVPFVVKFKDYSAGELTEIAKLEAARRGYKIGEGAEEKIRGICASAMKTEEFGNGRFSRNLVEAAIMRSAARTMSSVPALSDPEAYFTLESCDFAAPDNIKKERQTRIIGFGAA